MKVVHRERSGYALFLVLLLVILLSGAAVLVATQLQTRHALLVDQNRNFHLQNLLDSGVALGLATLSEDRYFEGEVEEAFDGGRLHVDIRRLGSEARSVTLLALYGGERRSARVMIALPLGEPPRVVDYRPMGGAGPELSDPLRRRD